MAYLMVVSSVNGFSPELRWRDNDGVDIELINKGKLHKTCTKIEGRIAVQLKSTVNWIANSDGTISYDLAVKNYQDLITTELVVPRILVLLCLPENEPDWLNVTLAELTLKKCAYWYSLRGMPETKNTQTVTLRIPTANLLTKDSLYALMLKVQSEEEI